MGVFNDFVLSHSCKLAKSVNPVSIVKNNRIAKLLFRDAWRDAFRTTRWEELFEFPEVGLSQIKQLMALGLIFLEIVYRLPYY